MEGLILGVAVLLLILGIVLLVLNYRILKELARLSDAEKTTSVLVSDARKSSSVEPAVPVAAEPEASLPGKQSASSPEAPAASSPGKPSASSPEAPAAVETESPAVTGSCAGNEFQKASVPSGAAAAEISENTSASDSAAISFDSDTETLPEADEETDDVAAKSAEKDDEEDEEESDEPGPSMDNMQDLIFFQKLEALMAQKKLFSEQELTRDDLAAEIGTNRTYLIRSIKMATGMTFNEYLNSLRVNYAATLLATTDEPLDLIGTFAGFRSKSAYYRAFTAANNCSPSDYRKRNR